MNGEESDGVAWQWGILIRWHVVVGRCLRKNIWAFVHKNKIDFVGTKPARGLLLLLEAETCVTFPVP